MPQTSILNSKLDSIEKYAFTKSLIKCISIPYNVSKIGEYAFSYCPILVVCKALIMIPVGID